MKLKKINAVLSLLLSLELTLHMGSTVALLFSGSLSGLPFQATVLLEALTCLHAILSIVILAAKTEKGKDPYMPLNRKTHLQRATGIAVLLLALAHIPTYKLIDQGLLTGPAASLLKALLECLFSAAVLTHLSLSFRNAFITLGLVTTDKGAARADRIAKLVCGVLALAAAGGILSFFIRRCL